MQQDIKIRSEEISLMDINSIKPNPANRNQHSPEQIDRLAKIIRYQGFRSPLIISNRSGLLVSGHGRLQSAKQLGLTQVPVIFQDFDDDAQEYAAMVSENSIASWAELDLSGINVDIGDLGPEFDIDLLGIRDFNVVPEFDPGTIDDQGKLDEKKPVQCPNCGEQFVPKG